MPPAGSSACDGCPRVTREAPLAGPERSRLSAVGLGFAAGVAATGLGAWALGLPEPPEPSGAPSATVPSATVRALVDDVGRLRDAVDELTRTLQRPPATAAANRGRTAAAAAEPRRSIGTAAGPEAEAILARLDALEQRLTTELLASAGRSLDAQRISALVQRLPPMNRAAVLAAAADGERTEREFRLRSMEDVLTPFGRPTDVWKNQGGLWLQYEAEDVEMLFAFNDGLVTDVRW